LKKNNDILLETDQAKQKLSILKKDDKQRKELLMFHERDWRNQFTE